MSSAKTVQALLDTLPIGGDCMVVPKIAKVTGISRKEVSKGLIRLVSRKLVERVEIGCYRLTDAGKAARESGKKLTSGPTGPRSGVTQHQNTLLTRVWAALRASRKATIAELLELAAKGDEKDAYSSTQRYLRGLVMAGYVVKMARREPGTALTSNGFIKFWLEKNTGPKAPVIQWRKKEPSVLFDPNTSERITLSEGGSK